MDLANLSKEKGTLKLAVQEGHDADIPTNQGSVREQTPHSANSATNSTLAFDKDVEKTSASSAASLADENHSTTPNAEAANVVWWDSDDDPQNPMNWSMKRKWGAIAIVAAITFLTPLGSSIFAPGVPDVMDDFHSNSQLLSGFVVSVYVLGFACGPLVIAPMSEMYGRLPLYHFCNVLFVVFNVCCGVSKSLGMLIAFRFLAGCMGSSPLTLGGGTIADLMPADKRAKAMSIWVFGPTIGPVIGPIAGGFITKYLGWRWNFYILSIAAGLFTTLGVVLMKETYAPVLLERKARRLRKETGNDQLKSKLDLGLTAKDLFWFSIVRPTKMLIFSPLVFFLSVYVAITYAYLYIFFTTVTQVFETQYHFRSDLVGLSFLGLGVGQFAGQFLYSYIATRSYNKHKARGDVEPEQRLQSMLIGAVIIPIGLFWYGWAVQSKSHWMNPIVALGFFSLGMLFVWMPANVYLIDVFTVYAASAMAANTVLRSLAAAVLPLAGPKMYAKLGYGWGNSLLGFIALVMIPIPLVFMKFGKRLRVNSTLKL